MQYLFYFISFTKLKIFSFLNLSRNKTEYKRHNLWDYKLSLIIMGQRTTSQMKRTEEELIIIKKKLGRPNKPHYDHGFEKT